MATESTSSNIEQPQENLQLAPVAKRVSWLLLLGGAAALALGMVLSTLVHHDGMERFLFAYLFNWAFVLAIGLGGLFFVIVQHLTGAGWSVTVRRFAEAAAGVLPILVLFGLPMVLVVASHTGLVYRWAIPAPTPEQIEAYHAEHGHHDEHHANVHKDDHAHGDPDHKDDHQNPESKAAAVNGAPKATTYVSVGPEAPYTDPMKVATNDLVSKKRDWLNPSFWLIRFAIYAVFWAFAGWWYWRRSVQQDQSGDPKITRSLGGLSAGMLVLYAFTVGFAAFDILMSLDARWYSTIFGVYYFANAACLIFAVMIITAILLQSNGYITKSITTEHYHDLGKFLFAFIFFWGYVAFSQYMLIWYAQVPDMIQWLARRGMTTETASLSRDAGAWAYVAIALLFGHFLLPFCGFMSRHIKRNKNLALFWALWMCFFVWLDMYWLVMPEFTGELVLGVPELACAAGFIALFIGLYIGKLGKASLRPTKDPRLPEALAFQNI